MTKNPTWQKFVLDPGDEENVWELFHENSKLRKRNFPLSDEEVVKRVGELDESLIFEGYPKVELPTQMTELSLSLGNAIQTRISTRHFTSCDLKISEVSTMLHYSYGISRPINNPPHRSFRFVPSAGALYPLEIFFYTAHTRGLTTGIYHYNPRLHHLRLFREGDYSQKITEGLVQRDLVTEASLILFITALFDRTVFKYEDRGYRFVLLEAGHLAQNLNLVSNGLGLSSINIGGYYDYHIDNLLDLDGLTHSTIYMMAIGKNVKP